MIRIGPVRIYPPSIAHGVLMLLAGGAIESESYWVSALFMFAALIVDVVFDVCKPHKGE